MKKLLKLSLIASLVAILNFTDSTLAVSAYDPYRELCEAFFKMFCEEKPGFAKCLHAPQDMFFILTGRMKTDVPQVSFENRTEFKEWCKNQDNTLLMVSKDHCPPCSNMHALLSAYNTKQYPELHTDQPDKDYSIAYISIKNIDSLFPDEKEKTIFNVDGTPTLILLKKGTVTEVPQANVRAWLFDSETYPTTDNSVDSNISIPETSNPIESNVPKPIATNSVESNVPTIDNSSQSKFNRTKNPPTFFSQVEYYNSYIIGSIENHPYWTAAGVATVSSLIFIAYKKGWLKNPFRQKEEVVEHETTD